MEETGGAERPNQEGFVAFASRAGEDAGPVVMLNLLAFRPDGGRERYEEYGGAVAPLLAKAGGRPTFMAQSGTPLLGDGSWDMVLLVEYPSRGAFLEMVGSEEYRAIAHLRTEALTRSELHPMDPIAPGGSAVGIERD
ncbi:MAG: DUF1330 domain-containing protein [Solirubrobacterales bacterium]|nr:DUF1330 domain-containing protein [Solirubrobacterales bacterium]